MALKIRSFDTAEYLETPEAIVAFLTDALKDEDPGALPDALGIVARAQGMSEIARKTGLNRQALYKSLSPDGSPEFSTVKKLLEAFGVHLELVREATPV